MPVLLGPDAALRDRVAAGEIVERYEHEYGPNQENEADERQGNSAPERRLASLESTTAFVLEAAAARAGVVPTYR
jgi:hypothetical protein